MGQSLAQRPRPHGLARLESFAHPLNGQPPPLQGDPPAPAEGHPMAWQGEAGAEVPWWAANVENFRSSFRDPQAGQSTLAALEATSF